MYKEHMAEFLAVKDMQTKLDEAEQLAVQGGRKVTSRLEQKIKVFSF